MPNGNRIPIEVASEDLASDLRKLLSLCGPREIIKPSEWQEKYRVCPPGSVREGRWVNYVFQREILDAIIDPECSSLCLLMCSQFLGKTSIVEGILGWMVHMWPCPTVAVFPTTDNAIAWSKNRFGPLIESTGVLSGIVDAPQNRAGKGTRSGYGQNTIVHKRFHGGWLLGLGSNSGANLRAHTAKLTVFDEIDAMPDAVSGEGDPIILVEQRSARYPDAFSIKTSTPTVRHFSRIEKEFENTDQRKWFVACLKCAYPWIISWSDIRWPKEKGSDGKVIHLVEQAYLECPQCKEHLNDKQREIMVEAGHWSPTNPSVRGKRGYHANAFIVLGPVKRGYSSWLHYFAQRFLDAKALGVNGIRTFQNLICGESFELESTRPPDHEVIYNRRESYPEHAGEVLLPERSLFLVAAADVQKDRIEAEILAYGIHDETWGISYKIFRGNIGTLQVWNELDEWLQKRWKHPSGHTLYPATTCIDSGDGGHTQDVYEFSRRCAPRPIFALKGERGYQSNWVARSGGKFQRLFIAKVDSAKEALYSRLRRTEYGENYQHFPSNEQCGYDATYFSQLTSETMRTSYVRGRFAPYFEKIHEGARNESLDVRIYAMAAKEILDVNYALVQRNLAVAPLNDWRPKSAITESATDHGDIDIGSLRSRLAPPSWIKNIGK